MPTSSRPPSARHVRGSTSPKTYSRSGIGSHYDHSDNFVLQQQGVKHWSLAPPSFIPRDDYAARMLGVPGVGSQEMPDTDVMEVTLNPGDLLYIPLMWLHSGVSEAGSLSISLVCPAQPLASVVTQAIGRYLQQTGLGHQAVAAAPTWREHDVAAQDGERRDRAVRALVGHLASEDAIDALLAIAARV